MLVFDIETNGLLNGVSKIHCIATFDTETETSYVFNNRGEQSGSIKDGINQIMESPSIAGHNIVGYDLPVIRKLSSSSSYSAAIGGSMHWYDGCSIGVLLAVLHSYY